MNDLEVKVSPEKEREVINWLTVQIQTALQDRAEKERRWQKWIMQYEEVLPLKKTFPWTGCSNISLPVTAIAVETIHAREVNTLFGVRPYILVRPKKKNADREKCADLERFLDQIYQHVVNLYSTGSQWFLEKNKMGTGYIKPYWCYDKKKVRKGQGFLGRTKWEYKVYDDVKVDVLNIEDVITPSNARDIQDCLFLDFRIRTDWNNISRKGKLGIYQNVEDIKPFYRTDTITRESGADVQKTKEDMEKIVRNSPNMFQEYEIHEVWFEYDIDDDGFAEPMVMTLSLDANKKMRWIYQPYDHGKRPIVINKYMERVNRIDGKGLSEMSEYLQDGINTVTNQTIDNMTIANAKVNKVRKASKEDIPKDGIYPGCNIYLDDPATDLIPHEMGEVHQSNFALMNLLRDYHERRTKVTDYSMGRESSALKSRATATGTLALLQESGRHFDLIINNSRNALVELSYQIIELYMQYRPDKIFDVTGNTHEMYQGKEQVGLPGGLDNLREDFEFYCSATSLAVNKEIEKQTNLLLLQQLGGIFQQMIQLLMMMDNPQTQLPPDLKKFIAGVISSYYRMAEDLIRSFEKIDIKSYLPDLPDTVRQAYGQGMDIQAVLQQIGGMMNEQGIGAGMEGFGQGPGMEGVQPAMSGTPAPGMGGPPGTMPNAGQGQ